MSIINKIGLEAEFFLRDTKGNLVYPSDHGFESDSFPIVGEFRAEPGKTRSEAIANFLKAYYEVVFKAKAAKLTLDIDSGYAVVTPAFHAEVMRKMDGKEVSQCKNIYDTDILQESDDKIIKGKVIEKRISAGLHVHFSSQEIETRDRVLSVGGTVTKDDLKTFFGNEQQRGELYANLLNGINDEEDDYDDEDEDSSDTKGKITVSVSRICKPVITHLVAGMDKTIWPDLVKPLPRLKYRLRGFYEIKPYGIEYRSLPFNRLALNRIDQITDHAFGLLEAL